MRSTTHNRSFAALLKASALTAATVFATSAIAQTATAGSGPAPAPDAPANANSAAAAPSAGQPSLGEIVVTAQRRSENIQKVPISVTAFGASDLKRLSITSPKNLQFATPGLTFPEDNGTLNPYIRGRGTGFSGTGLEGSIAIYVDDVYSESQFGTGDLIDVSQVQVLKGPQGTLYGRNATGGAILIKTNDPTHEFGGYFEGGYGNLNMGHVQGVLNLPVTETLAFRFAGSYDHRDGFLHNIIDGKDQGALNHTNLRMKALWEPSSQFSAVASVDFQKMNFDYERHQIVDGTGQPTSLGFYQTQQSPVNPTSLGGESDFHNVWTTNLHLTYKADKVTLTSITGYRRWRFTSCSDNDNVFPVYNQFCDQTAANAHSYAINGVYDRTFSEELRATTNFNGPLNFAIGGVYQHSSGRFPALAEGLVYGSLLPVFDNFTKLNNYSVYGEAYYTIAPGLKLTAGARWSKDSRKLFVRDNADLFTAFGIPPAFVPGGAFSQKASFSNVTPRAVLDYDAGDANYYVSYNKGFKSGGFNVPALLPQTPLKPETITSFEAGAKFKMLDNRLRLDLAVFASKSKNVQVASIDVTTNSVVQQNAAGVKAHGAEASLSIAASERLMLNLGAAYLHSRFTEFPNASVYQLSPAGLIVQGTENLKGFATSNSPDFTANAAATYNVDLPSGWSASVTLAGRYSSTYDFQAGAGGPLRIDRQKPFAVANLTGDFVTPSKHITISWYLNNMFQAHYYDQIQTGGNIGGAAVDNGQAGGTYGVPALPRTFGGAVRYTF